MKTLHNKAKHITDFVVGIGTDSKVITISLASMPHLLVAGTTGSGKSVWLNQVVISMMVHNTPADLRFLFIDPKVVEWKKYKDNPFMLMNPVTELDKANAAMEYLTQLMDRRYVQMAEVGARNIDTYNEMAEKNGKEKMKFIVCLIDEFSDLIGQYPEVEKPVIRLGQKARAAGIHVIIATQSPRVNVITGLMKANIPSRVSLLVASSLESSIILDEGGAEKLRKHGDLYLKPNGGKLIRAQGAFIDDHEIDSILEYLKDKYPKPELIEIEDEEIEKTETEGMKTSKKSVTNRSDQKNSGSILSGLKK